DVILMDVQMPEMDGLEASRAICARWAASERPRIIAMTAEAMQGDRDKCLAAGLDPYILKPGTAGCLAAALATSTPLSAAAGAARGAPATAREPRERGGPSPGPRRAESASRRAGGDGGPGGGD